MVSLHYASFEEKKLAETLGSCFDDFDTSEDRIRSICESIDYRKATGPDQFPGINFKNCSKNLSKSISQVFYKIWQSVVFPSFWKNSVVSAVHKKGSKSDVLNYRPVMLLCKISKIFERCLFPHLNRCFILHIRVSAKLDPVSYIY